MTSKLGRRYKLTFEVEPRSAPELIGPALPNPLFVGPSPSTTQSQTQAIEIRNPITIEFDIVRNTSSSLNSATFRVYNLSETNRNLIFQNRTSINNLGIRRKVILQAGYNTALNRDDELSTIFRGDLLEAYSYRQGPDVITYINAQDGGFAAYNSVSNKTLDAGTTFRDIAIELINGLKGVKLGKVGDIEGTTTRPTVLNGNSFQLLTKHYKDQVFIDLGKANIVNENEYIETNGGKVLLITSKTGLLATPQRQGSNIVIDMLFEPRIIVGQLVEINAQFNKLFDGQYKVMGIKHSGIISDAVNGDCRTSLQLYIGNQLLGELKGI